MNAKVTASSGNLFLNLGYSAEEAAVLEMRANLMTILNLTTPNVVDITQNVIDEMDRQ